MIARTGSPRSPVERESSSLREFMPRNQHLRGGAEVGNPPSHGTRHAPESSVNPELMEVTYGMIGCELRSRQDHLTLIEARFHGGRNSSYGNCGLVWWRYKGHAFPTMNFGSTMSVRFNVNTPSPCLPFSSPDQAVALDWHSWQNW